MTVVYKGLFVLNIHGSVISQIMTLHQALFSCISTDGVTAILGICSMIVTNVKLTGVTKSHCKNTSKVFMGPPDTDIRCHGVLV